jgi:hypothetical protein
MNIPGYTADASLQSRSQLPFGFALKTVIHTDEVVYPAQLFVPWGVGRPTVWPPIECPMGLVPRLVKTGGERRQTHAETAVCARSYLLSIYLAGAQHPTTRPAPRG